MLSYQTSLRCAIRTYFGVNDVVSLTIRLFQEHAYDEAVRGVGGIVHIASTASRPVPDPQMIIRPAVDATVGLLRSAVAHG